LVELAAQDPAYLLVPGSVQNGLFGPTAYNFGNTLTPVDTYDTLGKVRAVCRTSGQIWKNQCVM
jgi:hypothetical protein